MQFYWDTYKQTAVSYIFRILEAVFIINTVYYDYVL